MSALAEVITPEEVVIPSLLELFNHGGLHCRPDIPNEVYHADRSCVSTSGLKQILRSPAHYQAYLAGANRKETPAMFLGTATHSRLLEPELFEQEYVVAPVGDKRSKEWKAFEIANAHRKILTPDQFATLEGIACSVSQHQSAMALLQAGLVEHTLIWQDEDTGIWLKIRPDCLCIDLGTGICLDVKKTVDASPAAFARAAVNYEYDLQAAVYLEGLRTVFQRDFDFIFLAVEESAPYGCALYGAPSEMLERGQQRFRHALRTLKACRESAIWPSYQPQGDLALLDWPRYALRRMLYAFY
ncbi:MAG: PD-(D/E)XK nuclease-like domain-containing protein [Propionivibrio sp.]|uniref:PD-(D/E)XK nuclease-like domain-containing protein n=1 Tax=Candidatus Propionivibrio dominans TaxID=2954373 RepID=A0A9D7I645_9RHOO|nr:PD-(D/E)XK nuclease-like domain-containing protein [Candidatus Propionivibrio dominans]